MKRLLATLLCATLVLAPGCSQNLKKEFPEVLVQIKDNNLWITAKKPAKVFIVWVRRSKYSVWLNKDVSTVEVSLTKGQTVISPVYAGTPLIVVKTDDGAQSYFIR